ncbi:hypothetical protein [Streptomyces sp. WM6368]|uniref:hypothetical protein n=1 Tax=Streptomyces sp. WM6368 TaxID=1415554 RepID=UPI0006AEFB29|nr:hypothetical protein [Streptomyces sp. WM6368]KOU22675.1 hypothetical protein ADK51_19750 [Streptomyces sp. WM6368]
MATPHDAHTEVPHPLLRQPVGDIASGTEGTLMAVLVENTAAAGYEDRWAEIAYIRPAGGGIELTTAVANVEASA